MIVLMNKKAKIYIAIVAAVLLVLSTSFIFVFSKATEVFSDTEEKDAIAVPIVMYHSIMKKSPELGKYVITAAEFENDINYLKRHGYTSITMTELINYVYNNAILPQKPVIITFDDGNLNNYLYCKPILEKYGMKGVLSVIGKYSEAFSETPAPTSDPAYSHVSWDQIREINASGYFEIQNHTYNLHSITKRRNGAKRNKGESLDAYKAVLTQDVGKLQNKLKEVTGITPNTFTYPYGSISKESKDILKGMGFKATLSCTEGVNMVSRNQPEQLFGLKRKNRPHGISTETFFRKLCP